MKFPWTLTYWEPTGDTNLYGAAAFKDPVRLECRWETKTELFRDKTGQEINCKSKIFMLNREIDLNGYVYLGISREADPREVADAYEIRALSRIPDLRGMKELVVLWV